MLLGSISTFNMDRWVIITEFYFTIVKDVTTYLSWKGDWIDRVENHSGGVSTFSWLLPYGLRWYSLASFPISTFSCSHLLLEAPLLFWSHTFSLSPGKQGPSTITCAPAQSQRRHHLPSGSLPLSPGPLGHPVCSALTPPHFSSPISKDCLCSENLALLPPDYLLVGGVPRFHGLIFVNSA